MTTADARLDELIREVGGPVRRFLRSILLDPDLVEDVAQETYCTLIERYRGRFRAHSWESYALRVAWSKAVRRRPAAAGVMPDAIVDPTAAEPGRIEEIRECVDLALSRLEPHARAMLHLRYEQGHSLRSVARIMNLPAGTVKSRLHHARRELRGNLERQGIERVELLLAALWPLFPSPAEAAALERAARGAGRARRWAITPLQTTLLFVAVLAGVLASRRGEWPADLTPMDDGEPAAAVSRAGGGGEAVTNAAVAAPLASAGDVDPGRRPLIEVAVRRLDGSPVAGAAVRLLGSGAAPRDGVTGADGRCAVTAAHAPSCREPRWWVEVDAAEFPRQWKSCVTAMAPDGSVVPEITVWMPRPGVARGIVVDTEGTPVAGAEIVVWSSLAVAMPLMPGAPLGTDPGSTRVLECVVTGDDGRFVLPRIPVAVGGVEPIPLLDVVNGTLRKTFHGGLRVSRDDLATAWYALPVPEKEGGELEIRLVVSRRGALAGRVVDERGEPVAGVSVRALVAGLSDIGLEDLTDLSPTGPVWRAVTDGEGCYAIDDVPCPAGCARRVRVVLADDPGNSSTAIDVDVVSGPAATAPDLVIPVSARPRDVVVDVVGPDGSPVAGARVSWIAPVSRLVDRTAPSDSVLPRLPELATDAAGRVVLRRVRGAAGIRVAASGFGTAMVPRSELEDATTVDLEPAMVLRGVVRDQNGDPLGGLDVVAIDADLVPSEAARPPLVAKTPAVVAGRARTDGDGSFELRGLSPALHHLLFSRPVNRSRGILAPFCPPAVAWCEAELEPRAEPHEVVIFAEPRPAPAHLPVRVRDADGRPVLRRLEGRLLDARGETAASGVFDGPGRLVFLDAPAGAWTLHVAAAGLASLEQPVELAPGTNPAVELRLAPGHDLTGEVAVPPGASRARVRVLAPDGTERDVVAVDGDHRFEFAGLPDGEWTLHALARGKDGALLCGQPVACRVPDDGAGLVRLDLRPTVRFDVILEGLPDSTTGRARVLALAHLRIEDAAGRLWVARRADSLVAASIGPGRVRLSGRLPRGSYTCSLTTGDARTPSVPLDVPGNSPALVMPDLPELPR